MNEYDDTAEVYTDNTKRKKRLAAYAATYPDLCQLTGDDGQVGLRFEIDKHRMNITDIRSGDYFIPDLKLPKGSRLISRNSTPHSSTAWCCPAPSGHTSPTAHKEQRR